jgi:hypothetical protein
MSRRGEEVLAMSAPAKYEERFTSWLEEEIAAGGDLTRMVTLVNSYQEADITARRSIFREWLDGAALACGRCRTAFSPPVDDVEEHDEVLCVWCRTGSSWGLSPVPRRTFAR